MVRADVAVEPVSWAIVPGHARPRSSASSSSRTARPTPSRRPDATREAAGAERLILDLRGNPGGYVNEADAIASQFLTSGLVFIERDAAGNETKHRSRPTASPPTCRWSSSSTAGTASSSEIVVGRAPGRRAGADRRRQDVRDRHRPWRVPAVRRVGAARRHGRMADAQGPPDLARRHHPRRHRRARQRRRAARSGAGRKMTAAQIAQADRPAAGPAR